MARWRIEMLGGLTVIGSSRSLTHFESRKTAALLAHLALHPDRSHSREELAALIWPDAPFESSRNRLKQSLSSLRKLLEGDGPVFVADHFSLGLLPGAVETDVAQWERLVRSGQTRAAAVLWKGELLPGFYDDSLVTERERLNALKERLSAASAPSPRRFVRLPSPATRFFGREREREALHQLLQHMRWVTLTGPGGMGKTRLAIEVAHPCTADDVVFVPLAALHSVEQVLPAMATALEFPLPPTPAPLDALCGFLHNCPTLLVLDNAEHLDTPALATLCQTLLSRLPRLRLLVTSRQRLNHPDEACFPLEPLRHSDDACALFLDRARRARPDFPDTPEIAGLCALLEGMPLAIELCAAWGSVLSVLQMQERLERGEHSRLLAKVEAVFLSSVAQLTPERQRLLSALTVFRGGWTLAAAEVVCPTPETLEDLRALCDASLITPLGPERFGMLESLRRFAARLLPPDAAHRVQERHRRWCLCLATLPQEEARWLAQLDQEWDNCRSALETALLQGDGDAALGLISALGPYLSLRALSPEAVGWLERALALPQVSLPLQVEAHLRLGAMLADRQGLPAADAHLTSAAALLATEPHPSLQAHLHFQRGRLAYLQKDLDRSQAEHEAGLALRQALGDPEGCARSLHALGQLNTARKHYDDARSCLAVAEEYAHQASRASLRAEILFDRARLAERQGDYHACLQMNEACEAQARSLQLPRLLAKVWNNIGEATRYLGNEQRARHAYLESARAFCQLHEWGAAHFPFWNLACLYGSWEEFDLAVPTLACAHRLWEALNHPPDPEDAQTIQTLKTQAASSLGVDLVEYLWHQGRQAPPEQLLQQLDARLPQKR